MWFELCEGTTEHLIDVVSTAKAPTWMAAKNHFQKQGYRGKYILLYRVPHGFKIWRIELKEDK